MRRFRCLALVALAAGLTACRGAGSLRGEGDGAPPVPRTFGETFAGFVLGRDAPRTGPPRRVRVEPEPIVTEHRYGLGVRIRW